MLPFKSRHINPILTGQKTQTRRVWKGQKRRVKIGSVHLAKTWMFSSKHFAKLLIRNAHKERLGDITEEDALKEGYNSIRDFVQDWKKVNNSHDPDLVVWVIEFEVVHQPNDH